MLVGIDLGTSTSEISILNGGRPEILRDIAGSQRGILPSVVALRSTGELCVGEMAASVYAGRPENAVVEVKRLMGGADRVLLAGVERTPQEISAMILRHLKDEAEKYLLEPVTEAVITVPAYFNDLQRRATRDAAELAGLKVRRLVNEPTAAALAYGIARPGVEEKIVVYDLGGGTFDITVLELSEGVIEVKASTGDTRLGGKDFDEALMQHAREACRKAHDVDPWQPRFRGTLKAACKLAKEQLSAVESAEIRVPFIAAGAGGPVDFELTVTRAEFEAMISERVEATRVLLDDALRRAKLTAAEIGTVLLVGGSTRIPLVRQVVSAYFGNRPLRHELPPDEAVALGAAVLSGIEDQRISAETLVVTDVSNWTLGIEVRRDVGGVMLPGYFDPLIRKDEVIPRSRKHLYYTTRDGQDRVDVRVYQGDHDHCAGNTFIGVVPHAAITPGPAGQPLEIEFTLDLSENLLVRAWDVASGRMVEATLTLERLRMTPAEKQAARLRLERDSRAWQPGPLYEKVKPLVAHAEKRLDALQPAIRTRVEALLDRIQHAVRDADAAALDAAERELTDVLFELD